MVDVSRLVLVVVTCTCCMGDRVPPYSTVAKDLILSWKTKIAVSLLTCWNPGDTGNFYKDITKGNVFMTPRLPKPSHDLVLVADLSCSNADNLHAYVAKYYTSRWVLFNGPPTSTVLSKLPIRLDSELYYLNETATVGQLRISLLYRSSPDAMLQFDYLGHWINGTIHTDGPSIEDLVMARRRNLNGLQLRATIVAKTLDSMDTATEVNYHVTQLLAERINASIQFHLVPNWSSLMYDLVESRTDLGTSPSYMTAERLHHVRFLSMTGPTSYKFVFRSPKLSYTDNVFLLAFGKTVWLCVLAVVILSTVLLLLVTKVEQAYLSERLAGCNVVKSEGFSGSLLSTVSIVSQQESLINPKSLAGRILVMITLISLMFLYTSYSANIVTLIQSPSPRIRTLDDLFLFEVPYAFLDDDINRMHTTNVTYMSLEDGAERVRTGQYAFHADTNLLHRYMVNSYTEDEKCNVQELNMLSQIEGYYSMAKDSQYLEMIRVELLRLRETGILAREIALRYVGKPPCIGGNVFTPVAIADTLFVMGLIGWAIVLAGLILLVECLNVRYSVVQRFRRRVLRSLLAPSFKPGL